MALIAGMKCVGGRPYPGTGLVFLALITVAAGVWSADSGVAGERKAAVLFTGSRGGACNFELARRLVDAGFVLGVQKYPGLSRQPLTWERVRRYNVLVVSGLGYANADMTLPSHVRKSLTVVRRFLEAGGGVLVLAHFGQQLIEKPPQEAFLNPLGLELLFDEMPVDDRAIVATPWNIPFAWAEAVGSSALTRGVPGLWYPVPRRRIGGQHHSITFKAGSGWTVLLRGGPTSATVRGRLQQNAPTGPGSYASNVPIAAVRSVGRGRLVLLGISDEYLTGPHAWTTLEGIVLEQGLHGQKSGGLRFLVNVLRFLAEPSLPGDEPGGADNDPELLRNPHKTRFIEPFKWDPLPAFPGKGVPVPGVIGVRSRFSTGSADVAEWAAAARRAHLGFLVFLEDFARLTAEEFEMLKQECERVTTDDFVAIPGFTIDDEIGNHYFYFGTSFPYPAAGFLTRDGKRFRSRDPELSPADPYIPGQLSMTTLDYAYSTCGFRLTAGNYLFRQDAAPFSDFFSNWDAFAVVTGVRGRLVEDAFQDYLAVVDSGQGPVCIALDLLDDPGQLKRTRYRTVLRVRAGKPPAPQVRAYFDTWRLYPDNPLACFVTSGPMIEEWSFSGPRDYEGRTRGDFVWQNYRWRLRGAVSSEAGLAEVRVYDGPALFRRFLPGGAKRFAFELDLTHDKQHNLVLVAVDRNGGRAVSREQWDRNHRLEEFMCSDRNNQLSYGYLTRSDGTGLLLGGNQSLATPFKRIAGGVSPPGTFRNDALLGAPAFDGAAGGEPDVWEHVRPIGADPALRKQEPAVCQSFRLFHSADVHIGEGVREHCFTDGIRVANVWHTLWKTAPASVWTVRRRNTFFQVDPDRPVAVFRWRISFALKKAVPNRGFDIASAAPRRCRMWVIRASDGRFLSGRWEDAPESPGRTLHLPFDSGAYAAFLDGPMGQCAVFSLTDGLEITLGLPRKGSFYIRIPEEHAPRRAGEKRVVELLLVGLPRSTPYTRALAVPTNEVLEEFRRQYGLDGGAGAVHVEAAAGKVRGFRYTLEIDGGAARAFAGSIRGKLVSSLPIVVDGMNDRWSAVLYDGTRKAARPVGVFERRAWAVIPLQGRVPLFVGHPVTCDVPDLFLQVTQTGGSEWRVECHNPTDRALRARLRPNPYFPPFRGLSPVSVEVPPGQSVFRTLRGNSP